MLRSFLVIGFFLFSVAPFSLAHAESLAGSLGKSEQDSAAEKELKLYEGASDAQIKEAQNYYDACQSSKTLSAYKDCKCAATAYLEKRLELGDEATIEEVASENVNACLKNPKGDALNKDSLSGVTLTQKREAQEVFDYCQSRIEFKQRVDCECLGAKFLSERIKRGPVVGKQLIIREIQHTCKNVVDQVGLQYASCLNEAEYIGTGGAPVKEFCECYARKWGKLYESSEGIFSRNVRKNFSLNAYANCRYEASNQ